MPRKNHLPKYPTSPHSSGQARIRLGGEEVYLGRHGTPESHAEYARIIAEWVAGGRSAAGQGCALTVCQAVECYLEFARGYYIKHGKATSQLERVERSLGHVLALYSSLPAAEFSPLKLKTARQRMVDAGWSRVHVNHCTGCVKRAWKWLSSEELVPVAVYQSLVTVEGLKKGRTAAREPERVHTAPEDTIAAVLPVVLPPVRAMAELQLWTAMRPGEVCQIRPCDVDRCGRINLGGSPVVLDGVWVYLPGSHKTEHHGRERVILIGPKAQAILSPWLLRSPEAYCFSPREAVERWAGGAGRRVTRRTSRNLSAAYNPTSYYHAVARACKRIGCATWHPNQLRHNAGTRIGSEFSPEVARIVLGHSDLRITRVYLEDDLRKAARAIAQAG